LASCAIKKCRTLAEQIPRVFPQFCWAKHALFTFEDWEKRERSPRKACYLLGFSGAAGKD
ncbi:MAG: hypothetical protein WA728_35710, partial [Xanthobacteraceae bacterium]